MSWISPRWLALVRPPAPDGDRSSPPPPGAHGQGGAVDPERRDLHAALGRCRRQAISPLQRWDHARYGPALP